MGKCCAFNLNLYPAIFFDRDGVLTVPINLNGKGYAPRSLEELKFYDDASECLLRTRAAGFKNIVVSNQPDVSNQLLQESVLEDMNHKLLQILAIDEVNNCPHDSHDICFCRKPKPGMIESAARRLNLDLSNSWMVGDRDGDITAGSSAGVRTIFIDRGWLEESGSLAEFRCTSLTEAVGLILRHSNFKTA